MLGITGGVRIDMNWYLGKRRHTLGLKITKITEKQVIVDFFAFEILPQRIKITQGKMEK